MAIEIGKLGVYSEVGTLNKVLIHYPDKGIGGVIPSKAQEWLYEDIVHLERMPLRDRERRSRGRVVLRRAAFRLH